MRADERLPVWLSSIFNHNNFTHKSYSILSIP